MKCGLFFTGIVRVVLPSPGFDKEAVSHGLEKIGNEVVARMYAPGVFLSVAYAHSARIVQEEET